MTYIVCIYHLSISVFRAAMPALQVIEHIEELIIRENLILINQIIHEHITGMILTLSYVKNST